MTLTREATPYPHWCYTHPTSGDSLRQVPERGGLVTGWHSGGREWLHLDEARFADPSPWCASSPGVAPGAPFSAAMAASPARRGESRQLLCRYRATTD
jgi:hypothetical protein